MSDEIKVPLSYFQIMKDAGLRYEYSPFDVPEARHHLVDDRLDPVFIGAGKVELCAFLEGVKWARGSMGRRR